MINTLASLGMLALSVFTPMRPGQKPPQARPVVGVINVNTANAKQLADLPGVGKSRARAIVAYRQTTHFAKPEDLRKVKGVGRGVWKRISPHVAVSGNTTLHKL